jgi:hypothetical protein
LGIAQREIIDAVSRHNSPQNKVDFVPCEWSFTVGPITSSAMGNEEAFHVGWMALSLSGSGYLFPWTAREAVERAEKCQAIQAAANLCQALWPLRPEPPSRAILKLRKRMGDAWPYRQLDRAQDWTWGVAETG